VAEYCVSVTASLGTAVEHIFIEFVPAASTSISIKKLTCSSSSTPGDTAQRIRVRRETTAGSGGIAGTITEMNPSGTVATTTCNVKNGSTAFSLGTATDLLLDDAFQSRGDFEWIARDRNEYLWSGEGERVIVTLSSTTTVINYNINCFFDE
jgi:hypothetical protein